MFLRFLILAYTFIARPCYPSYRVYRLYTWWEGSTLRWRVTPTSGIIRLQLFMVLDHWSPTLHL